MNLTLFVMVAVLLGGIAFAFYMDWLGLWVSKEEHNLQIAESRIRRQQLEGQNADNLHRASGVRK